MELLASIFKEQGILTGRFHQIYDDNLLLFHRLNPVDFEARSGQYFLQTLLHWINAEFGEAAFDPREEQRQEEIIDVLHFLVEFSTLADISPKDITGGGDMDIVLAASEEDPLVFPDCDTNIRFAILASLRVAQQLRGGKPWKQGPVEVPNRDEFVETVRGLWYWWGACARTAGLDAEKVGELYLGKNQINHERIESGV